ncbi:hypothetical protein HYH03_010859 [Edaphochlamys debaryana]|uniref:non-specific serine/threonine protein kinase n=1 Tax=Edaphochlamys debaryana TaxID=47281 RepID=A0A835XUZ9_9CHLO|nr:hypothetical protein HYH03_010859 [Edaphochlamys debaryana]|eukprot:KAG2490698.1 hypothetical protein HYH03_010859 [Edaphochlamys debaryana]
MDDSGLPVRPPPSLGQAGRSRAALRASIAGEAIREEPSELQPPYERSSSAEGRGHRAQLLGLPPQGERWDRCNSADGCGPNRDVRQLSSAVEEKLKLAPLLAKRLERVSHSSGSFSSRSVAVVPANPANPSGRATPQRRTSGADYGKLNYLVTSLEGVRGDRNLKVEGSARLPQVMVRDQSGSPTQSRDGTAHSFDDAKKQVDRDLRLFLEDVRDLYAQISQREGADVPIVLEVIASIMDIAEECLETPIEDFKLTITDIVDNIEDERSACQQRTIRALYTRLLFILTRCSRLLITEQQHLFATEPRNRRRHSQVFGPGFTTKTQKELGLHLPAPQPSQVSDTVPAPILEEEPVFRSHTMPVKAMYSMAQQLKKERMPQQYASEAPDSLGGGWHEPHELARIESGIPDSPAAQSQGEPPALRHHSQSSDLEAFGGNSDTSMTGVAGAKKKKSLFGKISKGFKNLADGFKRKSSLNTERAKGDPDGLSRPHSEMLQSTQHVRFRVSSDQSPAAGPSFDSPGGSRRGTRSGLPTADSLPVPGSDGGAGPGPPRRLDQQRSVRFQETPVHIIGESDEGSLGGAGVSGEVSGDGGIDTGKRAKLMVQTPQQMLEDPAGSSPQPTSAELAVLGVNAARGKGYRRASVDLYAMHSMHMHGLGGEPMSPDGVSPPEDLTVICSICEEAWLSTHLEEHSIHCAVLRTLSGNGLSVDAQLTTIANVLEEWLETPLAFPALGPAPGHYHVKNQLMKLIKAARNAAALQPDGSKVPTTRCFSIQGELAEMLDSALQANKLAVVTQTYAHRVMRLITDKVALLSEPFGVVSRPRAGGGSDAGDSGTSTPRSMPGMSIEEFEIIKPISRGAFGRVYLARKLATGDLFAIKVMKKRDLIRKNMVESVTNERNILAMAQNPFVVRFYYSFTSRENLYIVMEYINGGDCYSLLRKFGCLDEEVARQYIAETVLALEYCHAQGIIHRDLKPDNLLINAQGHVKLTDFGLSCVGVIDRTENLNGPQPMETDGPDHEGPDSAWGPQTEGNGPLTPRHLRSEGGGAPEPMDASKGGDEGPSSATSVDGAMALGPGSSTSGRVSVPGQALGTAALGLPPKPVGTHQRIVAPEHEARRAVGTPDYLAPELLLGTGHGPEVDWWAVGAILYEFITGTPPFNADTPEEIFDNILDRRITWPDEDDMSCECRDLVDKLLHPNPLKRLGHRGAGEVKLHPWFEGLDWTSLARNKAAFIPSVEDETDTSYFESKHVSQRSMAEDLDKLRTSAAGERSSAQAGPSSGPAMCMVPGSGPPSGIAGGRTQVDRLKDQFHREGSSLRSVGSSNSHGSSHMSRTSYTGQAAANVNSGGQLQVSNSGGPDSADAVGMTRMCSSPNHHLGGPDSGPPGPGSGPYGRSSQNQVLVSGSGIQPRNSAASSSYGGPLGGLRNSGSGARNSGSGARNSGSGARNSGSGSAGQGPMSDRPSPGSAGTARVVPGAGEPYEEAEYEEYDEAAQEPVEGEEGDRTPSGSGGSDEEGALDEALHPEHDPFGNFFFTNFTGLSAANMEKIQKLREHFNRRQSYSGPGQDTAT